jgi:hypothetical protein
MTQHLNLAKSERIFYLSELLYFSDQIEFSSPLAIEFLVSRVQMLLLLFDRILLSPEHIMVSATQEQTTFKEAFFRHPVIQSEIQDRRIITSMWGVCSDIQQHIDASKRYISSVTKMEVLCLA